MKLAAAEYGRLLETLLAQGHCVTTRVRGGSMLPAIPDGAVARLAPVAAEQLRLGEVILTRGADGGLLCHRLVRLQRREGWLQTWGDTAPRPDTPVAFAAVLARVESLVVDGEPRPLRRRSRLRLCLRAAKRLLVGRRPAAEAGPPTVAAPGED